MNLDIEKIENALSMALLDSVQLLQNKIIDITPRDPERLPKNVNVPVTGNLKRSIAIEQVWKFEYKIWTLQGQAEYAKFLEFWTARMQPRSFLRKWIIDNKEIVMDNFQKRFNQSL